LDKIGDFAETKNDILINMLHVSLTVMHVNVIFRK